MAGTQPVKDGHERPDARPSTTSLAAVK